MNESEEPIRLLAVEDDPTDRSWLELMLKDANVATYTLRFVGSMRDALGALENHAFDCVLLDLSLPDCEGLETVRRVHDADPSLSIVVFTGSKDQDIGLRSIESGAQDYLVKGQASGNTILQSARWARARMSGRARITEASEQLIDRLLEAWVCVDLSLDVDVVNAAFLQLVGCTEPEVLGVSVTSFVSEEDAIDLLSKLQHLVSDSDVQSVVSILSLRHRLGHTLERTVIATPTRSKGAIDGLFILFGPPPPPPPPP